MAAKASLNDIVEALEFQSDAHLNFLDRETGEVELISREALSIVEHETEDDQDDEGEDHEFEIARAVITEPKRFEPLPTECEVHEWEIMREFAESVRPDWLSDKLQHAIHGRGAFRCFKDTLRQYHREKEWHAFRADALREIAIDWCRENDIAYNGS